MVLDLKTRGRDTEGGSAGRSVFSEVSRGTSDQVKDRLTLRPESLPLFPRPKSTGKTHHVEGGFDSETLPFTLSWTDSSL